MDSGHAFGDEFAGLRHALANADLLSFLHIITGGIQIPPLFYWIDLNSDSKYDQVWIDRGGQGRCDDIALYEGPVQGRALLPFYTELATR